MAIIRTQEVRFRVRISFCIFKRGRLKHEWCWKQHQISHFLPSYEYEERGGRDIHTNFVEALTTPEPPEYMATNCVVANGVLIKKINCKKTGIL